MAFDPWDPFAIPNMPEDLQANPRVLLRDFQALGQIPDFCGSQVDLPSGELDFNTHIDAVIVKTKRAYLDRRLGCLTVVKPSQHSIQATCLTDVTRIHVVLLKDTAQQLSFTAHFHPSQDPSSLTALVCSQAAEHAFQDALEVSMRQKPQRACDMARVDA